MSAALSADLRAYGQILLQPLLVRRGSGSRWVRWLAGELSVLSLVMLLSLPVAGRLLPGDRPIALFWAGLSGVLALIWWGTFLRSAVTQNAPAHAGLVPHLRRRLVRTTLALGATIALALASMIAGAFGHFALALVGVGWLLATILLAQRFAVAAAAVPLAVILLGRAHVGDLLQQRLSLFAGLPPVSVENLAVAAGLLLLALALPPALRAVFPRGGDAHWRAQQKHAGRLARLSGDSEPAAAGRRWRCLWHSLYFVALRRAGAAPQGAAAPVARAMLALGPKAHWGTPVLVSLATLLFVVAATPFPPLHAFLRGAAGGTQLIIFFTIVVAYLGEVVKATSRTAAEQGLLRLAPGVPPAGLFNRPFARALLAGFARVWLVATLCACAIDQLYAIGADDDWTRVPALATLMLPLAVLLLRDYAALRPSGVPRGMVLGVAGMAGVLLVFAIVRLLLVPLPWSVLALADAALAAGLLWVGWRRMMVLPVAFPAGRRGKDR